MTGGRRSIAALLITVAALAGCSSDPIATRPLTATETTGAASSPTPTAPTKAQAAKLYLAAVGPANKAVTRLNSAIKAGNLKRIHAAAKVCERKNRAFLGVLTDTQWPKGVQRHADKLSEIIAGDQSAYTALTTAKTLAEVDDATATISADNSQSQLMRVKLGLGAVPAV